MAPIRSPVMGTNQARSEVQAHHFRMPFLHHHREGPIHDPAEDPEEKSPEEHQWRQGLQRVRGVLAKGAEVGAELVDEVGGLFHHDTDGAPRGEKDDQGGGKEQEPSGGSEVDSASVTNDASVPSDAGDADGVSATDDANEPDDVSASDDVSVPEDASVAGDASEPEDASAPEDASEPEDPALEDASDADAASDPDDSKGEASDADKPEATSPAPTPAPKIKPKKLGSKPMRKTPKALIPKPSGETPTALVPKLPGKGVGTAKAPFNDTYPSDPHHLPLMAQFEAMIKTGMTQDHVHSLVHVGSLFLAQLSKSAGMTNGHYSSFEAAKKAHGNK